jgi:hypothetical protein
MGWLSQRASKRAFACLAVISAGGIAGLVAGFSTNPDQTSELSPAEIVAMRFPGGPSRIASDHIAPSRIAVTPAPATIEPAPAPAGYVLASVGEEDPQTSSLMFNPSPTYSSHAYSSPAYSSPASSPPPRPALPPQLVTASIEIPSGALAYASPEADEPAAPAQPAARPESPSAAPAAAKRAAVQPPRPASPNPASQAPASQGPASASNAVLNNAQIASIKERLKLTSYQDQLWPPVESALRDISWHQGRADAGRKVASGTLSNPHGGTIDPNSVPVQRLKSAAFPLIMSLSDDQKQEVRTMVRLMGLENLASQF